MTLYRPPPLSNSRTLEQLFSSSAPLSNALASRFSTRLVVITGSLLAMAGYVLSSLAQSSWVFFFTYGICIGAYKCVVLLFRSVRFVLALLSHTNQIRALLYARHFVSFKVYIYRAQLRVELRTLD